MVGVGCDYGGVVWYEDERAVLSCDFMYGSEFLGGSEVGDGR